MDKTYQLGDKAKTYLIAPWTTETVVDQQTCFETDGPTEPQSLLPNDVCNFRVKYLSDLSNLCVVKMSFSYFFRFG